MNFCYRNSTQMHAAAMAGAERRCAFSSANNMNQTAIVMGIIIMMSIFCTLLSLVLHVSIIRLVVVSLLVVISIRIMVALVRIIKEKNVSIA